MDKIPVKTIALERVEYGQYDRDLSVEFDDSVNAWAAANSWLIKQARSAPNKGYDKVDFMITFTDGNTYKGRYDLQNINLAWPNLESHVRNYLLYLTGEMRPSYMSDEQWREHVAFLQEEPNYKFAKEFIENYDIPGI